MSPFDQNIDYDAGHAIDPSIDQDDLIAFHIHELSASQERALHRVLRTSPTLQSESVAIATTLRAFPKQEAALPLDAAALDRHWQTLRSNLTPHIAAPVAPRSFFPRWALPALAASVLATTALVITLHHGRHTPTITVATTQSTTSTAPSIPPAAPTQTALTASTQRTSLSNQLGNKPNNPASFPPSTPEQAALTTPNLPPTEPLTPTPPTQVAPATTINPTIATTESSSPQSTNPTSAPSTSPTQLTKLHPPTIRHPHTTDITLAIFADLTATGSSASTSGTGTSPITQSNSQTASPAVGALAAFHQQFRPWLGYRVTATYFHPTFEYTNITSTSSNTSSSGLGLVNTQVYELSGTYVVQGPHRRRLTTSTEAGASLLDFHPNPNQSQTTSIRAAAVVGVGTEYALTKRFSLHAGYRALIYKAPAFSDTNVTGTFASTNTTFSSNPILGITYRFGANSND
jgi:opacity protein-like surface antigen